ncbi:MAG: cellulase family glycosylhydrolase [Limisphaerales bacterium]
MSFLEAAVRAGLVVLSALAPGSSPAYPAEPSPQASTASADFVRVSPRDPRYLELSDGTPYIPIGLNLIAPPGDQGLPGLQAWMEQLQANGGNYIRVWLSNPFFDVEHARCGDYDEAKAKRIEAMLAIAARHGIRVKLCLEHFRHLGDGRQAWAAKPLHLIANGGTAADIGDFFNGTASREQFKKKLAWFARRFGDNPAVFGWELWNEINAVQGGDYLGWTEIMLPELHRLFPRNLAMQSLGSYDGEYARAPYRRLATMPGNDVAQVHRYLDLGAKLEICRGPMDLLAADAVRELLSQRPGRPVLLAESGAVEPSHSGPFKLYSQDTNGVLLHDVLFAPFFAGAAGPGHIWHWDSYVARQNLWWHFGRFAQAVKDLDPPAEHFQPDLLPHSRLRVYVLKGRRTVLLWCRDAQNTWRRELAEGQAPAPVQGIVLDLGPLKLGKASARLYDPWENRWTTAALEGDRLPLPEFKRSLVARLTLEQEKP